MTDIELLLLLKARQPRTVSNVKKLVGASHRMLIFEPWYQCLQEASGRPGFHFVISQVLAPLDAVQYDEVLDKAIYLCQQKFL